MNLIERQLRDVLIGDKKDLLIEEPLKKWTTWRIGGPAEYLVFPRDVQQVVGVIKIARENQIPIVILGNGSNVLVKDQGIRGLVINTAKLKKIEVSETNIVAESGISMPKLAKVALENSLTGLEFSVGIPASLGGAILMNAGAWGKSIGELIKEVKTVDANGEIRILPKKEIQFSYRKSSLQKDSVIVGGTIELTRGNAEKIRNLMALHQQNRIEKQPPLKLPNAGSVFKNPKGYAAGYLIESVGLKGFEIGGAKISDKHANFIINSGEAKADDILKLMEEVIRTVESNYGIHLEPEVNVLG